jgi:hypothetical protein
MHEIREFNKLIKIAKKMGFQIETRNNKIFVYHKDRNKGFRTCHPDQKGYHDLCRFIYKN